MSYSPNIFQAFTVWDKFTQITAWYCSPRHTILDCFRFSKKEIDLADKYLPKVLLGLRLHLLGTGLLT